MSFLRSGHARATAATAALLALLVPTAAHAIVYGEADAGRHPYVGSFLIEVTPPGGETYLSQLCTGTLVTPRVVLTAGHCMETQEFPEEYGTTIWFTLDEVIDADGDWTVDPTVTKLAGTPVPHPKYFGSAHYRYDVGAFVLDADVIRETYGTLAPVGALDDKGLRRQHRAFIAVGYGIERETRTKSTQSFLSPKRRMLAYQTLTTVNRDFATYSMNQATGNGGTCYGDSGGPHFAPNGTIVSITTTGDLPCKAIDQTYRVDTTIARDFLKTVGVQFHD
ncbi:trypsin-like serine protease [Nocardioides glacieisoli]|uniref:Trypsin-like serine protease n=1 Tax=Nocardioides glacieisoli TaxID=1168730 RepID=A0A4Q2RPF2_9ACTN|nr:trypsin-like serine protease [Nocardioides glacieisoli]RYB89535.1 trypsin-like serine protease [Nocardioides glacieisoli]